MNQEDHLLAIVSKPTRKLLQDDDTIFHYTKTMTALGLILPDQKLKLNYIDNFRDPKEKHLERNFIIGENKEVLNDNIFEQYNSKTEELKKLYAIACFCSHKYHFRSRENDNLEIGQDVNEVLNYSDSITPNFGYNKDRMWEVYSENHTGVCLAFSKNQIESENDILFIKNVIYSKKFNEDAFINSDEKDKTLEVKKYLEEKFLTKDFDYRDENEIRLMKQIQSENDNFIDISKSLKAIIFGIDFNMNLIDLFINMVLETYSSEIIFIKATLRNGSPGYLYVEI